MKLNEELLNALYNVKFVIFISRLFYSFMTLGKKEFINTQSCSKEMEICVISSSIKTSN